MQIVGTRNANSSNACAKIEGNKTIVCGEHRWAPKPERGVKGEYDTERVLKTESELAGPGLEGRILEGKKMIVQKQRGKESSGKWFKRTRARPWSGRAIAK